MDLNHDMELIEMELELELELGAICCTRSAFVSPETAELIKARLGLGHSGVFIIFP